jgi:hypothetical protein
MENDRQNRHPADLLADLRAQEREAGNDAQTMSGEPDDPKLARKRRLAAERQRRQRKRERSGELVFWQTLSIQFVDWAVDCGRLNEDLAEDKAEIAAPMIATGAGGGYPRFLKGTEGHRPQGAAFGDFLRLIDLFTT